jgi:single-stranded DNA-binding protein
VISQYIRKGDQVSLYGRMRQETWKDESGQNRSKMKLVVSNVTLPKRTASRDEVLSQPVWDSTPVVKMDETEAPF